MEKRPVGIASCGIWVFPHPISFFFVTPIRPGGGGALGLKLTAGAAQNRGAKKWPLQ